MLTFVVVGISAIHAPPATSTAGIHLHELGQDTSAILAPNIIIDDVLQAAVVGKHYVAPFVYLTFNIKQVSILISSLILTFLTL